MQTYTLTVLLVLNAGDDETFKYSFPICFDSSYNHYHPLRVRSVYRITLDYSKLILIRVNKD